MLFAEDVDTINGMLNTNDLKTDLHTVLDLVVETANGISKKRYNHVKQDEEAQHYLACLQCLYTPGVQKLSKKINVRYHRYFKQRGNRDELLITPNEYPQLKQRFDYEILDLGCALATYGFNVNVWPESRIMMLSKNTLIDQMCVDNIASLVNQDDNFFFIKKCQAPPKCNVTLRRKKKDGSADGFHDHNPSWVFSGDESNDASDNDSNAELPLLGFTNLH